MKNQEGLLSELYQGVEFSLCVLEKCLAASAFPPEM